MTIARAALCAALMLVAAGCSRPAGGDKAAAADKAASADKAAAAPPVEVDKAFADKVHAYLLSHPEVILEMQDAYVRKQADAEATKVQANLPALRQQIFSDPRDPSVGPRDAKVTVVEFFDYRCPHCKDAAPDIVNLIRTHPDVRFVFKEMPIFGPQSQAAASVALAAGRQGRYLPVYQALMADRQVDQDSVTQILTRAGLSPQQTFAMSSDPKIATQIADVAKLAQNLGISGTPGFFVNDHYVAGADIPTLTKLIDDQRGPAPPQQPQQQMMQQLPQLLAPTRG